ncbi:cyclopropane-fatty-acyl-phospholipid synthase, partial [Phenoliferia sp. Uapishka_3]
MSLTSTLTVYGESALDRGLIPDFIVRRAIRYLSQQRLDEIASSTLEQAADAKWEYIEELKARLEIAIETEKANEQHYEVSSWSSGHVGWGVTSEAMKALKYTIVISALSKLSSVICHFWLHLDPALRADAHFPSTPQVSTEFIQSCLGKNMKYSCCLYPTGKESLDVAEDLMLESYCEKAKLVDGMDILDLGCGWGSLTLFLAKKYPKSRITSLSNSATQKIHIDSQAALRGLSNVEVFTGDVKVFDFAGIRSFDRVMSIEMFEHMKNYDFLLAKISTWLKSNKDAAGGNAYLFVHIFCHKDTPYHFEENDGWMSRNFFSGGTMPSFDLFSYFQRSLTLERSWWINGRHYGKTCEDWLILQDSNTKKWIGSGREGELVTGKKGGSEEERKAEGVKSFYK